MIDACAAEVTYSAIVTHEALSRSCSAIHLDEVGSATASLLSIVHFLLVCRASSRRKDRKGILHIWRFKTCIF